MARRGADLNEKLWVRILDHVAFIAVKPLLRGLAAEAGLWIGRVAVYLVAVVITVEPAIKTYKN